MEGAWRLVIVTLLAVILAGMIMLLFERAPEIEIVITPGLNGHENRIGIFGAVREPGYYSYKGNIRIEEAVSLAGGLDDNADPGKSNLARWIEDGETIIIPTFGGEEPTLTPAAEDHEKVDLNSADAAELMKLPGIGEKRAEDIIKLREQKGRFTAKEDILEIPGISKNLLEKIYDLVIVQ